MYKILIADDVKNNRRAIKLSISDLEDNYQIEYIEAENGKVAVDLAKENNPDIIFMDVMMPEMDGIEATKIIKKECDTSNTLIIAITALDDHETKKNMINAGVKDFITKPFDDQELFIRTKNYIELIETKKRTKNDNTKKNTITLYKDDTSIKSFRTVFKINSEANLIDFWEFFDSYGDFDKSQITDQVNLIVTVTKVLLKVKKISSFDIIVEESANNVYITIWNETFIKATKKYFDKFSYNITYKEENDKVSFKVDKVNEEDKQEEAPAKTETPKAEVAPEEAPASTIEENPIEYSETREKIIYDFLDEDDLVDLQDAINDLNGKLMIFGSGSLEEEDIAAMTNDLLKISTKLKLYPQTFTISNALGALADSMEDNVSDYIENSSSIAKLFVGFGNDMELWLNSLFFSGTEDLHFLDDTIISNAETIKQFAVSSTGENSGEEEDLDDIFDF